MFNNVLIKLVKEYFYDIAIFVFLGTSDNCFSSVCLCAYLLWMNCSLYHTFHLLQGCRLVQHRFGLSPSQLFLKRVTRSLESFLRKHPHALVIPVHNSGF